MRHQDNLGGSRARDQSPPTSARLADCRSKLQKQRTGSGNMDQKTLLRRVVYASLIGATVEWYDFFLYGVVAGIVFNKLYFPAGDPVIATLLAYTTFAVGFVTRPLGGVIFGHFGDRLGRKSMLILTLMIMGV